MGNITGREVTALMLLAEQDEPLQDFELFMDDLITRPGILHIWEPGDMTRYFVSLSYDGDSSTGKVALTFTVSDKAYAINLKRFTAYDPYVLDELGLPRWTYRAMHRIIERLQAVYL